MSTKGLRKSSSDDFNQTTVERVLRLIRLMRRPIRKTRTEYAKLLGVSERSVYRYFNLIESRGFFRLVYSEHSQQVINANHAISVKVGVPGI